MDDTNTHLRFPSKYHPSIASSINDFIIGALLFDLNNGILDDTDHTDLDNLNIDLIVYILEQSVTNDKFREYAITTRNVLYSAFCLMDNDTQIPNLDVDARHRQFITILYQLYLEVKDQHKLDPIIEDYIVIWIEKKVAKSAGKT